MHTCVYRLYSPSQYIFVNTHIRTNVDCFTTFQLNTGAATTNPDKNNTCSLTFSIEEEMQYSVRFEEGYDLYDERYESWLKINHPDVVSKTCTATSPHNTQISEAQQASMSSTQIISPSVSHESSSTQSVSQSSPLLTVSKPIQTPVSSNGTPAIAGPSSSSQDQSAPGSTSSTTAAKRYALLYPI